MEKSIVIAVWKGGLMGKKAEDSQVVPYGIDAVWGALLNGLADLKFKIVSTDEAAHAMEIKTGVSLRSWGEKLHVELVSETEGTRVSVRSAAKLGTTLFDYGKNAENVRKIIEIIHVQLG